MEKKNLIKYNKNDRFLLIEFDKSIIDNITYYKSVEEYRKYIIELLTTCYSFKNAIDKPNLLTCSFEQVIQSLHQSLNYNDSDFRCMPYIIRNEQVFPL